MKYEMKSILSGRIYFNVTQPFIEIKFSAFLWLCCMTAFFWGFLCSCKKGNFWRQVEFKLHRTKMTSKMQINTLFHKQLTFLQAAKGFHLQFMKTIDDVNFFLQNWMTILYAFVKITWILFFKEHFPILAMLFTTFLL